VDITRWIARAAALVLFVVGTVATGVRFGALAAFLPAAGTILYLDSVSERIWPAKAANGIAPVPAADAARRNVPIQIATAIHGTGDLTTTVIRAGGLTATVAGVGGGSATLGGVGLAAHGMARASGSAGVG
jgi:hypothetical protein